MIGWLWELLLITSYKYHVASDEEAELQRWPGGGAAC